MPEVRLSRKEWNPATLHYCPPLIQALGVHNLVAAEEQVLGLEDTFFNWNRLVPWSRGRNMNRGLWQLSPMTSTQILLLLIQITRAGRRYGLLHTLASPKILFPRNNLKLPHLPTSVLPMALPHQLKPVVGSIKSIMSALHLCLTFTQGQLVTTLVFMSWPMLFPWEQSLIFRLWTTLILLNDAQKSISWPPYKWDVWPPLASLTPAPIPLCQIPSQTLTLACWQSNAMQMHVVMSVGQVMSTIQMGITTGTRKTVSMSLMKSMYIFVSMGQQVWSNSSCMTMH